MNSEELREEISSIIHWATEVSKPHRAVNDIMSLLSKNCWLKDDRYEVLNFSMMPVKPIEVDK
jgi:hypothetical protein